MRRCLMLLSLAALASAGCVMGDLDHMVPLDRSLSAEDAAYVKGLRPSLPGKMKPVNVAGDAIAPGERGRFEERWYFPFYGAQQVIVSGGDRAAGVVYREVPSLFPGLSRWLFCRWGHGASFQGAELSRRCWTFQLNPIIGFSHASGSAQTMGWELCIGKGLLAISNSPRSLEGGGLLFQVFWLGRRSEYTALETGF